MHGVLKGRNLNLFIIKSKQGLKKACCSFTFQYFHISFKSFLVLYRSKYSMGSMYFRF